MPAGRGTRLLGRLVGVILCAVAGGAVFAAAASAENYAYIQPLGPDGPTLNKPAKFDWGSVGIHGSAFSVKWSHWRQPKATAKGRTRFCVTMNGGCGQRLAVTITASERKPFQGAEGETWYVYCKVTLRGHFDRSKPKRVVTVTTNRSGNVNC